MSKKISLGVTITIALIAMAVTFSLTMVVSMNMFNSTVSSVKSNRPFCPLQRVFYYQRGHAERHLGRWLHAGHQR